MPEKYWQAAKDAVRNTVKCDTLERSRSKINDRFEQIKEKLELLSELPKKRRVVHKKILKYVEED
jgi:hypothetical protein